MFEYIKEKKNIFIIAGVVLIVVLIILFYFTNSVAGPKGIILFYGEGCPRCKIVDDFISQNKIEDKVKFTRLEVFNNKDNAGILLQKASICKIDQNNIGVPFLWDGTNCLVGDEDVISFFKKEANIK